MYMKYKSQMYIKYKSFDSIVHYDEKDKVYYAVIRDGESFAFCENSDIKLIKNDIISTIDNYLEEIKSETNEPLKPCPFCGNQVKLIKRKYLYEDEFFTIVGTTCNCSYCMDSESFSVRLDKKDKEQIKQQLIKNWNTRKEPEHA